MEFINDIIDERRATSAGIADAQAGVDASNIERLLDAWVGQVVRGDAEDDLSQRRASFDAQRARNDLSEVEGELQRLETREEASPISPLLIVTALVVLFGVELVSATIMTEGIGIPLRHRLAVAAAYSIGLLVVTRATASIVQRKSGPIGWIAAAVVIFMYGSVIVLAAAARFLGDENDLSSAEIAVEGAVAVVSVIGPAVAMHFLSMAWLRARPAQKGRRSAASRQASLRRTLKSSHATLESAQRDTQRREARRIRMKAMYLSVHRREIARLARLNEAIDFHNPEEKR